jgi:shikimate kinase
MESESGKQLQSVLEELGEELFLERQEEDAIKHTIDKNNLVISPGGSIIYSSRAMEHLKHISKVIYLKTSFETIEGRIQKTPRRIVGLKEKTLQNIFDERTSLYERWADIVINAEQDEEKLLNQLSTLL